jgi:homoserine kinase
LFAVSFAPPEDWRALVVLPEKPLATIASRAVLPEAYSRADVVANLQRVAVLTGAFAAGRGDLIAEAMRDRMHQPYRSEVCPLLQPLLTVSKEAGVLGVALSGAGPAVLILVDSETSARAISGLIPEVLPENESVEILHCGIETSRAQISKLQQAPQ